MNHDALVKTAGDLYDAAHALHDAQRLHQVAITLLTQREHDLAEAQATYASARQAMLEAAQP